MEPSSWSPLCSIVLERTEEDGSISAWVKGGASLRLRVEEAAGQAARETSRVPRSGQPALLISKGWALFRSLVSPFQVGYYYLHCAEEKPKAKQLRAHTEWSWDPNPRSVHLRSPLQRAASPTPWVLKGEPSHAVQLARVWEGWGGVLKGSLETSSEASLGHPCLAPQLPSHADVVPSTHRNELLPTHPSLPTCLTPAAPHTPS